MDHQLCIELQSPEETWTSGSAALLWKKRKEFEKRPDIIYRIYKDGKLAGETKATNYTLEHLESGTSCQIVLEASEENGNTYRSNTITVTTAKEPKRYDVTLYGAVGDGRTKNTDAIQRAIDDCTAGGMVYVPAGIFVTGALYLKSDMTLYIEKGGKLLGSSDIEDFPVMHYRFEGVETVCYASLINVRGDALPPGQHIYRNITIAGKGTIDANGSILRQKEMSEQKGKPGRAVCIRNTDGVYMYGVTIRQSPAWCVHLIYSNHICLNQVEIYSKYDENGIRYEGIVNGDGLDPDSCSNVNVFQSVIASQDDCIAIKSGRDAQGRKIGIPSENIRISNCRFLSGFGVCVGSEMSGSVRNVLVQDCIFEDVYSVGSIKAPRGRGGIVEHVLYENCRHYYHQTEHTDCKWFRGAVYVDQFYSHDEAVLEKKECVTEATAVIRDITFRNIVVDTLAGTAVYLCGLPERHLEHITLEDVIAAGHYGMRVNYVDGLNLKNVDLKEV